MQSSYATSEVGRQRLTRSVEERGVRYSFHTQEAASGSAQNSQWWSALMVVETRGPSGRSTSVLCVDTR